MASAAALATVYDFSSSFPTCVSWWGWYRSGTTYICYGTVSLASGDSIATSSSITVYARDGITLSGNNTVGSASVPVNLQTDNGTITAGSGTTLYGDITSNNGSITLTGATVTGSLTTNGTVTLTGGSVTGSVTGGSAASTIGVTTNGTVIIGNVSSTNAAISLTGGSVTGNVTGANGVTTKGGTVITGDVTATSGKIDLTGGSVGSVFSKCCSLTTNGTDIKGSVSAVIGSASDTVSITGGTISGAISTSGGKGISITNATVTSGSITTTNVPITISNSTIGSSSSPVNVTNNGNQSISITGTSVVYGDVTTGGTLTIDTTSSVVGTCTPDNPQCKVSVVTCTPPSNTPSGLSVTCVCDSFPTSGSNGLKNSSIFNSDWLISTSDSTGLLPRVVNKGYLRLTDNTVNNAKAATVPGIFPAAGNYISVEFKHYAYNSSTEKSLGGGDGIAVTLSDYSVPPVPGAYGGSLGYAQKTSIHDGFAGGWIGVGIDEFGNYQNPTEGRKGGPGARSQTVAVRGAGSGQSGYNWLAGTAALSPLIDNSASTKPSLGYYYQVIVDARGEPTQTAVTVNRDTGSGYAALVSVPNVYTKATANGFTQSAVPLNWQISFTGATGDATNIHEIGGLRICAQTVLPTTGGIAQIFSAIDEAYGTPSSTVFLDVVNYLTGHIYTKLVGTPFKLNIAALDNNQLVTTYAAKVDKTVTVKLVDNSDGLSDTSKDCSLSCTAACKAKAAVTGGTQTLTFKSGAKDKGQKQSADFTINSAYQKLVAIISDDTTTACSIDSFAVRPQSVASVSFGEGSAPPIRAGNSFSLKAMTAGVDGKASLYTGVMKIDTTVLTPSGGATVKGTLTPEKFPAGTSGTPSSTASGSFTYSEVGAFTLPGYSPLTDGSSARGVYDDSWTTVDSVSTKGDCVAGSYANTKTSGKYGCNFGLASSAVVGRFIPHHFNTVVLLSADVPMPCPTGLICPALYNGFVYGGLPPDLKTGEPSRPGQAFTVNVHAKNAADETTQNYDATMGLSKAVTLSAWSALGGLVANANGALNDASVPAASFATGTTALTPATPNFTFTKVPSVPTDIYLRASEAANDDGTTSLRGASSVEGGVKIVSGRVRLPNAYGSELLPLPVAATVQYYDAAGAWITSTTDSLTQVTLAASYALTKNGVVTACTTTPATVSLVATSGALSIVLGKPGCGSGSAKIVPVVPSYLQLVPGFVTFGVYKSPLIYRREVY